MTVETRVIKVYESFKLGFCKCGCSTEIEIKNKSHNLLVVYKKGHHKRGMKYLTKLNWIGRRILEDDGYWRIYLPDYFNVDRKKRVLEHVYFYQEYYKCCMLPWGVVHHKDENKENNMIWNLQGMTNKQHQLLHNFIDMSGRRCSICGLGTYIKPNGRPMWYGKTELLCKKCYDKK